MENGKIIMQTFIGNVQVLTMNKNGQFETSILGGFFHDKKWNYPAMVATYHINAVSKIRRIKKTANTILCITCFFFAYFISKYFL